jgi:BirA family biotin operon repressor/biotin-[acetyl-CoA-carboxylase] ligase
MRPTTFSILRVLADGAFHSGESLGRAAGMGRANVWHAIHELEERGLHLHKVRGRGYRLAAPVDLLDSAAIGRHLAQAPVALHVEALDACASTNTLALQRAAAGAPSGTAIACEVQEAGRGRRGRPWLAPLCGSLAFSLLWRFERSAAALAGLSLAAGVACVRVLRDIGVGGARLKWPNDILHEERKLGGILIELAGDYRGPMAAVCGIGLNTRLTPAMQHAIGQPVTDLAAVLDAPPARSELLARLLVELAGVFERFSAEGFTAFRDEWLGQHAHQGEAVRVLLDDSRVFEGRALGVGDDGALLIERAGRIERFHSGDVSVRRAA